MAAPQINTSAPANNAAIDAQCALANGGSMELRDVADVVLAVINPLPSPCWAPAAGSQADLASPPLVSANAINTGTAHHYVVLDSGAAELWRGTVGTTSADNMVIATLAINAGDIWVVLALKHTVT